MDKNMVITNCSDTCALRRVPSGESQTLLVAMLEAH